MGEAWANALNDATDVTAGMTRLAAERPDIFYKFGSTIEANLRKRLGFDEPIKFPPDSFEVELDDLSKPLVLCGPRNIGKTSFACAHGAHPLVVYRVEDLRKIGYFTDVVVWENTNFRKLPISEVFIMLSQGRSRSLRARHTDVYVQRHIKMIFTTSESPIRLMVNGVAEEHTPIFPITRDASEMAALRRLYTVAHVDPPMY